MKKYFFDEVINTQEIAHKKYVDKPVLIVAKRQTKGRGRKGNEWINSDQALACSFAFKRESKKIEESLLPLIASYEFSELLPDLNISLKWPNDLIYKEKKIAGLLIEKYDQLFVVGLGVNFFWKKPEVLSAGALFDQNQSSNFINMIAENWAKNLIVSTNKDFFDLNKYKLKCTTIGKLVEYGEGRGWVQDIGNDGSLSVKTESGDIVFIYESMISEVSL